jgi:hypothetical protein
VPSLTIFRISAVLNPLFTVAVLSVDLEVLNERVREIRMNTIKFLEQYLKHFPYANLPIGSIDRLLLTPTPSEE